MSNALGLFELLFVSRFDGVVVGSEEDVVDVGIGSDASIPPVELRLDNSNEITCMDLQYDPMTLLTRGPPGTSKEQCLSENQQKVDVRQIMGTQISDRVVTLL